jgi:hypothetical protein
MAAPAMPELVRQPHGGAIHRGGKPGNAGNRVMRHLHKEAARMVASRMEIIGHIADGTVVEWSEDAQGRRVPTLTSPKPADRVRAVNLLWDIANSHKKVSLAQVKARLKAQVQAIRETLPPEQAEAVLAKLAEVWK